MTRRLWALGLSLAGCGCLLAGLSLAADEKKDAPRDGDQPAQAEPDPRGDAVADLALAGKLEEYGRHSEPKQPLALITAASILRRIPVFEPKDKVKVEGDGGEQKSLEPFDPEVLLKQSDKLLADAVKLAREDAALKDLAERVKTGKRGGLNGPMEFHMRLRPRQTDTYNLKFKRNAWVRVAIRQETDNPVGLYAEIRNGRGDVRASDASRSPVLGFMPHGEDGTDYTVKVRNNGPNETYYFLFTN
jgi:hypothetical protein